MQQLQREEVQRLSAHPTLENIAVFLEWGPLAVMREVREIVEKIKSSPAERSRPYLVSLWINGEEQKADRILAAVKASAGGA